MWIKVCVGQLESVIDLTKSPFSHFESNIGEVRKSVLVNLSHFAPKGFHYIVQYFANDLFNPNPFHGESES